MLSYRSDRFASVTILFLLAAQASALIDCMQSHQSPDSKEQCFSRLLMKGQVSSLHPNSFQTNENNKQLFIRALQQEIDRLTTIRSSIVLQEMQAQPVLKWSQNISHIFLSLKNSHRWDSPGCLLTHYHNATLNATILTYSHICTVSQQRITFALTLSLYADVLYTEMNPLNPDGVSVYSALIEKYLPEIWPFLTKDEVHHLIWTEMAQRYPKDHKKYQKKLSDLIRTSKYEVGLIQVYIWAIGVLSMMCLL